jgi:hypothetical protein
VRLTDNAQKEFIMTTKKRVAEYLKWSNLDMFVYDCGDGIKHIKFAPKGMYTHFHACPHEQHASSWKEALIWIKGYNEALVNHQLLGNKI